MKFPCSYNPFIMLHLSLLILGSWLIGFSVHRTDMCFCLGLCRNDLPCTLIANENADKERFEWNGNQCTLKRRNLKRS